MDYKLYCYKKDNGSYLLHFYNDKGLHLSKVKEMFSAFGTVLSVYNRGEVNGLCFVICATFEDAKRCLDGIQHEGNIKILRHKKKSKECKYKDINKKENPKQLATCSSKDGSLDSVRLSARSGKKFGSNSSISSIYSDKTRTRCKNIFDKTDIPTLMPVNNTPRINSYQSPSSSVKVIPAEEIIVANIHPSLSVHYILHLFEKYNPISISHMMMTPMSKIRYCHVYYETFQKAFATMQEFDTYCLCGEKLIVLTKKRLIEEAVQL